MVRADQPVQFEFPETQARAPMRAEIAGDGQPAIDPVEHQVHIEEPRAQGTVLVHILAARHRMHRC